MLYCPGQHHRKPPDQCRSGYEYGTWLCHWRPKAYQNAEVTDRYVPGRRSMAHHHGIILPFLRVPRRHGTITILASLYQLIGVILLSYYVMNTKVHMYLWRTQHVGNLSGYMKRKTHVPIMMMRIHHGPQDLMCWRTYLTDITLSQNQPYHYIHLYILYVYVSCLYTIPLVYS